MFLLRLFVAGLVVAFVTAGFGNTAQSGPSRDNPKKIGEKEIVELIAQLSNDDYKIREQATKKLMEFDDSLPRLQGALQGADLETQVRLRRIIAAIEPRLAERFIKEAVNRVNEDGIDLFLDRMVLQKDFAEKHWPAALKLVSALAKRTEAVGGTVPKCLKQDFLRLPVVTSLDRGNFPFSKRVLMNGAGDFINLHNCFAISSGSIKSIGSINGSILFVNGDIGMLNSTSDSIIFCNGTIKSFNSTTNSLIFCNGLIESMNYTEGNTVLVRGELRSLNYTKNNVIEATRLTGGNLSEGNTYLNSAALPRQGKNDQLIKVAVSPLTLFQYFDPARVGLAFSMVHGDAQVDGVADGKLYARAGLKKGDLILAVNQEKFMTQDAFVGLLRRKVLTGEALLKVQRDDRILNIRLRFDP